MHSVLPFFQVVQGKVLLVVFLFVWDNNNTIKIGWRCYGVYSTVRMHNVLCIHNINSYNNFITCVLCIYNVQKA